LQVQHWALRSTKTLDHTWCTWASGTALMDRPTNRTSTVHGDKLADIKRNILHSKHKMMSQDDCWHLLASVSGHLYSELRSTSLHSTSFIISLHLSTCSSSFFIYVMLCYVECPHLCLAEGRHRGLRSWDHQTGGPHSWSDCRPLMLHLAEPRSRWPSMAMAHMSHGHGHLSVGHRTLVSPSLIFIASDVYATHGATPCE
jgi:hypothetical protein